MHIRELNIRDLDKPLKYLRIFLIIEGVILILINTLLGHLGGLVYIFVIFIAICLFCQVNTRTIYQFLIVLTLLLCFLQVMNLLYFIFYRKQNKKNENMALQIVISGLEIFVLLTAVLIIWRHYQKKTRKNINNQVQNHLAGLDDQDLLSDL